MLKNFLKTTLRSLAKDKYYSLINILGLAIGLTVSILIILFIYDELTYDQSHLLHERIYRLESDFTMDNKNHQFAATQIPLAPTLMDEYPEIVNFTRCAPMGAQYMKVGDREFREDSLWFADSTFFDVFTHPFIYGNSEKALTRPNTMVVTESFASRYFGPGDPVGKTLSNIDDQIFEITGVIKDLPSNLHFRFNGLISTLTIAERVGLDRFNSREAGAFWNIGIFSYVLVGENSDIQDVVDKFPGFYDKYMRSLGDQIKGHFDLMVTPLAEVHLNPVDLEYDQPRGNRNNVYIFLIAGLFILVIASINYMNMATARSARRAKEVGMRKVTGAQKRALITQFLGESMIITLISLGIAILLVKLLLPYFNDLSSKQLSFGFRATPDLILGSILISLVVGFISGSYPAFYLSSFNPLKVLKGRISNNGGRAYLRKTLVLVQFTISVIMILGTMAVSGQLNFLRNTELGFDKENVIVMTVRDTTLRRSMESFKEELLTHPEIIAAATSTSNPGRNVNIQVQRLEGEGGELIEKAVNNYFIDYDYVDLMGIRFLEGRPYSEQFGTDPEKAFIVNEAAVREFGWEDGPLGKRFQYGINLDGTARRDGEIVGVFKDYHYGSLHNKIEPIVLLLGTDPMNMPFLSIRTSGKARSEVLDFIDQKRQEFGDSYPFEYTYLNEDLNEYYREEAVIGRIFRYFTVLTILIASLGLLGLSAFMAQRRTREIGIRKVAGSSAQGIVFMFFRQYTTWVLIANAIGITVAYFGIERWLQDFQYRINIGIPLFLSGLLITLIVALATVTWQSWKAALVNPAVSLKYE